MKRLALGTVQFGLNYGVANSSGQVTSAAVQSILARALEAGVDTLDTAIAYGTSEVALGQSDVSSWRVVTKLPALPAGITDVFAWAEREVRGSLQRLGVQQLEALLLHKPSDLLGPQGREYAQALVALRAQGYLRAAGVSIYDPAELDAIWAVWQPDIVQAPCNVLDRRLIRSGWLAKLNDHGVRVHVRSVLLQGLLVMPVERRPAWFDRWADLLDRWLEWCRVQNVSPLHAAVAFVDAQVGIERYVIGVDSLVQLDQVLAAASVPGLVPPEDLLSDDMGLLDPSRWNLT